VDQESPNSGKINDGNLSSSWRQANVPQGFTLMSAEPGVDDALCSRLQWAPTPLPAMARIAREVSRYISASHTRKPIFYLLGNFLFMKNTRQPLTRNAVLRLSKEPTQSLWPEDRPIQLSVSS